ncbi:hypothetical protein LDL36_20480 [Komagataeibacter sp. FNDCR1]|nr:hypothetical protein [Komagataeibacter sp. FNDCR1]
MFDRAKALPLLRQNRLLSVAARYFPQVEISDDFLWEKLRAEESLAEARFRTFFHPRQMFPQGYDQTALAALNTAGYPTLEEPGYDYDPGFFSGDEWGFLQLRRTHIVTVQELRFCYPNPQAPLYVVPSDWIRYDRKYGRINIVATQTPSSLPLNVFVMGALSGGRTIPLMLQVVYQAGLTNPFLTCPEVPDYVLKRAVLSLIEDQFLPQSGSVSIDGISQSLSVQVAGLAQSLEGRESVIEGRLNGIRMGFV